MRVRLFLLPTAALLSPAKNWTFVGAGGCDVSDDECHTPSLPFSHQIVALHQDRQESTNVTTGGTPSWLHINGDRSCLFAALTNVSKVASYEIVDGALVGPKSVLPSGGKYPVKLDTVNRLGGLLLVANYGGPTDGASVTSMTIGEVCKCCLVHADTMRFNRSSVDPQRQLSSHIHTVVVGTIAMADAQVYAADLGGDAIYRLSVHLRSPPGSLRLQETTPVEPRGSGPRHLAVGGSYDHRVLYVVHEMANAVSVHKANATGPLREVQRLRTVPGSASLPACVGFSARMMAAASTSERARAHAPPACSKAAEIALTHHGSSLYVSNRGYGTALTNTIAGYAVGADGLLTLT